LRSPELVEGPAGARITDYISLGVITKTFPLTMVRAVLAASGKASLRQRDLPAHVVMYYVIAPGLRPRGCTHLDLPSRFRALENTCVIGAKVRAVRGAGGAC
jgi:hypothetical protein